MSALSIPSSNLSGVNEPVYLRLKQALLLNLRRQILIAVCDDFRLRQTIITRLLADFALVSQQTTTSPDKTPQWVSLTLNLDKPHPINQIKQWLDQNPSESVLGFQILGVEQLTRQTPATQWSFLRHLRTIENHLPSCEFSLLMWISSPWLGSIQQSAPEFWRWRTGVFEFVAEPTPTTKKVDSIPTTPKNLSFPQQLDQILQKIEQYHQTSASADQIAITYRQLGQLCRQQLQIDSASADLIQLAIQAYETGLEQLDDEASSIFKPAEIVDWLNDLGTFYWMLFHHKNRVKPRNAEAISDLEQSIICYQKALMKLDPQDPSAAYGRLQKNLGAAYGDLAKIREPVENLQQSILAYQEAIRPLKIEIFKQSKVDDKKNSHFKQAALSYAAIQNNLGTAYWSLAQSSQPINHLRAAISAYTEALRYSNPEQSPLNYAMLQTNVGTAYWNLAQHDPSEKLLRSAIHAYQNALKSYNLETHPIACAATQNNLGIAYWHLARRQQNPKIRAKFLERACASYDVALRLAQPFSPSQLSFDPKATHNNLGLAHYQLGTDRQLEIDSAQRETHLETALHHHLLAAQFLQPILKQEQTPHQKTAKVVKTEGQRSELGYLIRTLRALFHESGSLGQNRALSQIPSHLLPEILRAL